MTNVYGNKQSSIIYNPKGISNYKFYLATKADAWYPIISLRLADGFNMAEILIKTIAGRTNNTSYYWSLIVNDPDNSLISGTDNADWQSYEPQVGLQYDVARDANNYLSEYETELALSGFVYDGAVLDLIFKSEAFRHSFGRNPQGNAYELIFCLSAFTIQSFMNDINGVFSFDVLSWS